MSVNEGLSDLGDDRGTGRKSEMVKLIVSECAADRFELEAMKMFLKESGMDYQIVQTRASTMINCKHSSLIDKLPLLMINTKVFQCSEFIEVILRTTATSSLIDDPRNHESLYAIELCKEKIGKNIVNSCEL